MVLCQKLTIPNLTSPSNKRQFNVNYNNNYKYLKIRCVNFLNFFLPRFHEMGLYDAPASIDFILNYTQRSKLSFVGHSAGTTVFYVMASERPEYNRKIAGHISLAPLGYVGRTKSSLALLAPFAEELKVR